MPACLLMLASCAAPACTSTAVRHSPAIEPKMSILSRLFVFFKVVADTSGTKYAVSVTAIVTAALPALLEALSFLRLTSLETR